MALSDTCKRVTLYMYMKEYVSMGREREGGEEREGEGGEGGREERRKADL